MTADRLNEIREQATWLYDHGAQPAGESLLFLLAALDAAEQQAKERGEGWQTCEQRYADLEHELEQAEQRAVQAEQERGEALERAEATNNALTGCITSLKAAEARLAEQKAAFISEHETDHAEIRSLQARLAETLNALDDARWVLERLCGECHTETARAALRRVSALTTHPEGD